MSEENTKDKEVASAVPFSSDVLLAHQEKCRLIGQKCHQGQTRRDGTTPYFAHCVEVSHRLERSDHEGISVAYLHDTLEDTGETSEGLLAKGVRKEVVRAVVALTKIDGEPYENYLAAVKSNSIAKRVKIADMLANLADKPTDKQIRKYAKGLLFLLG